MPIVIDHIFVLLFAVGFPLHGWYAYRQLMQEVAAGQPINRVENYQKSIVAQWLVAFAGITIWLSQSRPWSTLGFDVPHLTGQFWIAAAAVIGMMGYFSYTAWTAGDISSEQQARLQQQLDRHQLQALLPANKQQLQWFYGLSVTAGIVEETLWRGYLFWYLSHQGPTWVAALIAIIVFGLGHIYQGWRGVVHTALMGAVLLGLYWLTGSLWLSMILHAAVDILQGRMIYTVLNKLKPDQAKIA